jgi:deoxyribonuclease-4
LFKIRNNKLLIGSNVSISGGLLGAAKEAASYNSSAFMCYTGAPHNSVRKNIAAMKIDEGHKFMRENGISGFCVHAPYIVNPASPDGEKFSFAAEFLSKEMSRTKMLGADLLVIHPGSAVGRTAPEGIERAAECLNRILADDETGVTLCLETMAGRGSEIGKSFEELQKIISGVIKPERIGVCFDTCHTHDTGYDIVNDLDGVMLEFDKLIGLEKLKIFHINGSLNPRGLKKDRHANLGADESNKRGKDHIGLEAVKRLVHSKYAEGRFLILETPEIADGENLYRQEIELLLS